MKSGKSRLLEDLEDDDPILSVVNLIDVFLVIIAALLLAVANRSIPSRPTHSPSFAMRASPTWKSW